ncbi:hypothetical protein SAMN04488238_11134 [Roseicitreum antarcticum]|uniref:Uncharacterized protein n=1 Tax=Roseicitreum antarcticum TaxID=564137 RepID=A0A1H3D1H3_9RHOB|nr:hypothetical protein SAMN04488238_11134 [Roseicitreum antarcticum]
MVIRIGTPNRNASNLERRPTDTFVACQHPVVTPEFNTRADICQSGSALSGTMYE